MLERTDRPRLAGRLIAAAAILVAGPTVAVAEGDLSTPCPRWAVDTVYWSPAGCFGEAAGLVVSDVNAHGIVVGDQLCFGSRTAFMWTEERGVEYFPFPAGASVSRAFGITDDGLIAGTVGLDSALRGWVYDGETMTIIDPIPGATESVKVTGITPDGTVTGEIGTLNPEVPFAPFRWKDGVLITIEDPLFAATVITFGVTDDGIIFGHYVDADYEPFRLQAFLLDGETVHSLPLPTDATYSDVRGQNDDGSWWGTIRRPDQAGESRPLPAIWSGSDPIEIPPGSYRQLIFDHAVADGVYAGRAMRYGSNHTTRIIWDQGVIRLLEDVVEHPEYIDSFRVDHTRDGTMFLLGDGAPDVNIVSMIAHPSSPIPGDLDCDGLVQFDDVLLLLSAWNGTQGQRADLDGDGQIGLGDLQALLKLWN